MNGSQRSILTAPLQGARHFLRLFPGFRYAAPWAIFMLSLREAFDPFIPCLARTVSQLLRMSKLVASIGFPPIPQKTRNGWGTERLGQNGQVHSNRNQPARAGLLRMTVVWRGEPRI